MENVINRKVMAYGFVADKETKKFLSSKELTLARISQAFYIQTAAVMISGSVVGKP